MKPQSSKNAERSTRVRRAWLGLSGAGALGFVALTMLAAPIAATTPVLFHAPYATGHPLQAVTQQAIGSGARVTVSGAPTFLASTGGVTTQLGAVVKGDGITPGVASFHATVGLGNFVLMVTTSSLQQVSVGWTLNFRADQSVAGPLGTPVQMVSHVGLTAALVVRDPITDQIVSGSSVQMTLLDRTIVVGNSALQVTQLKITLVTAPLPLHAGSVYLLSTNLLISGMVLQPVAKAGVNGAVGFSLTSGSALTFIQVH